MFLYHYLKNLSEEFDNFFVSSNQIHQHNTRNASKLYNNIKEQTMQSILFLIKVLMYGTY
jgi:hypothetical protein